MDEEPVATPDTEPTETGEKAMWWLDDPKVMGIGGAALEMFLLGLCLCTYCCFCRKSPSMHEGEITTRLEDHISRGSHSGPNPFEGQVDNQVGPSYSCSSISYVYASAAWVFCTCMLDMHCRLQKAP